MTPWTVAGQNGPISIPTVVEHVEEACNTENVDALHLGKYQYLFHKIFFAIINQNTYGRVNVKQRLHSAEKALFICKLNESSLEPKFQWRGR